MFHMLSCFTLAPDCGLDGFRKALTAYADHLKAAGLLEVLGPVGERQSDTILDTDEERAHTHFVMMSFHDRAQSDAAVSHIEAQTEPARTLHHTAYGQISDPVFICWQDT